MISGLKEYGKYISIAGFRDVKVEDVNALLNRVRSALPFVEVQLFNAEVIAGVRHLFFATLNALKAFADGVNISNNLAVEVLLYASGQRQIQRAIEMLGITIKSFEIAVIILARDRIDAEKATKEIANVIRGIRDDSVLEIKTDRKFHNLISLFNISDMELSAMISRTGDEKEVLTDLLIERGALLVTQR